MSLIATIIRMVKNCLPRNTFMRRNDVCSIVKQCMKGSNLLALCTGRLCIEPPMKNCARTSLHTGIIQVKQTQLITKDISISNTIHVEPLNKHLIARRILRPSNWLALCTGRLCIQPRMRSGTKTSRRTGITQVKQNQLFANDIFIIDRIRVEPLSFVRSGAEDWSKLFSTAWKRFPRTFMDDFFWRWLLRRYGCVLQVFHSVACCLIPSEARDIRPRHSEVAPHKLDSCSKLPDTKRSLWYSTPP